MTKTILKLIDSGAIRGITIRPVPAGSSSEELGYKYTATIRYEWAADAIRDFKTLEELDAKLIADLQEAATRFLRYIDSALVLLSQVNDE